MSDRPLVSGLDKVAALAPGAGWATLGLLAGGTLGGRIEAVARAEVGARLNANLSAFAFSEASAAVGRPLGFSTGVGLKAVW